MAATLKIIRNLLDTEAQMPEINTHRIKRLALPWVLFMAGCSTHQVAPPATGNMTTEQRLSELERRMERLESRPLIEAPYGNLDEIQARIDQLESERIKLLIRYTEQHPAIRDINRKLLILREQLKMLQPGS
jgi:hypothetical protein